MKIFDRGTSRRSVLTGGAVAALAFMLRPILRSTEAQSEASITAVPVAQVPTEPGDPFWSKARTVRIPLNPQNIVLPRVLEAGAKSVTVRAMYDAERIAFRVDWQDPERNVDLGTVLQFRDAVAVQFPEDPSLTTPSFMMGQQGSGVVIYHWKSDWQFSRLYDVDEAYPNMYADWYPFSGVEVGEMPESTDYLNGGRKEFLTAAAAGNAIADPEVQKKTGPVQKMRAEGFGSIEPDALQDARGKGVWGEGRWRIVISIPRNQAKFKFEEGASVPLALAVWDGSRDERNGQKAFSNWHDLRMGTAPEIDFTTELRKGPLSVGALASLLGGIGGLAIAVSAAVIGFRMRRSGRRPPE